MDCIFVNGSVRTLDPSQPHAQAIAVKKGRIAAVGPNRDLLSSFSSHNSKIIDLNGKTVLPGFTDSHTHFIAGGFSLQAVDLRGSTDTADFTRRIADRAAITPAGRWVTGGGWDQETWPGAPLPHKGWLDTFTATTPVFVTRIDLHIGLANSAALRLAGITAETPDPCGGEIMRDSLTGEPTGILKDKAVKLIEQAMPRPSREERNGALKAALQQAARNGVTSIHDITDWGNPDWSEWAAFNDFRQRGELTCRIFARLPLADWDRRRNDFPVFQTGSAADPWLRFGGLKAFTDGSLGGRTAYFFEPYTDAPGYCGLLLDEMYPEGDMERRIKEADLAGLPVSVHAIGDRANAMILDIFSRITNVNPVRDRRFRIEHAQHLRPKDIQRMAELGIVVSIQPAQVFDDGGWAELRIGEERCRMTYAFHSLAAAGACLVSGSDWPVAPLDPLLGIYVAATRCTANGRFPGGWHPEQRISSLQAIEACTVNAAYAEFAETEKGTIVPGKFADLTVLSEDPAAVEPAAIKDVKVLMTVAGGNVVYQSS